MQAREEWISFDVGIVMRHSRKQKSGMKHHFNLNATTELRFSVGIVIGVSFLVSCASKPQTQRESRETRPVTLVPMEWTPSLQQMQTYVEETYEAHKNKNQTTLNREAQNIADLVDAQLFITYVLLMERLDENDRRGLFNEQKIWLLQRAESARGAIVSKGGSLEALEYASAFRSITERRLAELDSRLSRQPKQAGDNSGSGEK